MQHVNNLYQNVGVRARSTPNCSVYVFICAVNDLRVVAVPETNDTVTVVAVATAPLITVTHMGCRPLNSVT